METEYLGNAYTTQSSNDGCVAVACHTDAGCAINACGTAACGANACPADICVTAENRIIIISTHDKNIVDLADVTINLDKGHIFEAEVL